MVFFCFFVLADKNHCKSKTIGKNHPLHGIVNYIDPSLRITGNLAKRGLDAYSRGLGSKLQTTSFDTKIMVTSVQTHCISFSVAVLFASRYARPTGRNP